MKVAAIPPVLLAQWSELDQIQHVEALGSAGGLSGACFWRIRTAADRLCLKRWPIPGPRCDRLTWIHGVLQKAVDRGLTFIPAPRTARSGQTFVSHEGANWELAPWLPGASLRTEANPRQVESALTALARFHLATADAPPPQTDASGLSRSARVGPSPTLGSRRAWLIELLGAGESSIDRLWRSVDASPWPELRQRMAEVRELFPRCAAVAWESLEAAHRLSVPLQPVIRDVWRDNLLFSGDELSGLVDFGAMRIDSVACDLARALGSLAADDAGSWQAGLAAYGAVRPLSSNERQLVDALDAAAVTLTCLQWAQWICLEGRQFPDPGQVLARIDFNLGRMRALGRSGAGGPSVFRADTWGPALG